MRALSLRAHSGAPAVQSCAQRLLWHCRQVLFKQLESWLVHGLLLDSGGEFFVQRSSDSSSGGSSGAAARAPGAAAPSPSPLRLGVGPEPAAGALLDWEPLEWHAGFQVGVHHCTVRMEGGGVVNVRDEELRLLGMAGIATAACCPLLQ